MMSQTPTWSQHGWVRAAVVSALVLCNASPVLTRGLGCADEGAASASDGVTAEEVSADEAHALLQASGGGDGGLVLLDLRTHEQHAAHRPAGAAVHCVPAGEVRQQHFRRAPTRVRARCSALACTTLECRRSALACTTLECRRSALACTTLECGVLVGGGTATSASSMQRAVLEPDHACGRACAVQPGSLGLLWRFSDTFCDDVAGRFSHEQPLLLL